MNSVVFLAQKGEHLIMSESDLHVIVLDLDLPASRKQSDPTGDAHPLNPHFFYCSQDEVR